MNVYKNKKIIVFLMCLFGGSSTVFAMDPYDRDESSFDHYDDEKEDRRKRKIAAEKEEASEEEDEKQEIVQPKPLQKKRRLGLSKVEALPSLHQKTLSQSTSLSSSFPRSSSSSSSVSPMPPQLGVSMNSSSSSTTVHPQPLAPINFHRLEYKIPALLEYVRNFFVEDFRDEKFSVAWQFSKDYCDLVQVQSDDTIVLNQEKINTCSLEPFKRYFENRLKYPTSIWREKLKSVLDAKMQFYGFKKFVDEDTETAYKRMLSSTYKIYLMPRCYDFFYVVKKILENILWMPLFRSKVKGFSVSRQVLNVLEGTGFCENDSINMTNDSEIERVSKMFPRDENGHFVPAIVIHPIAGLDNASEVLDILKDCFKNIDGYCIPQFAQDVTSLISYVQGNDSAALRAAFPSSFTQDGFRYCDDFLEMDVIQDLQGDDE